MKHSIRKRNSNETISVLTGIFSTLNCVTYIHLNINLGFGDKQSLSFLGTLPKMGGPIYSSQYLNLYKQTQRYRYKFTAHRHTFISQSRGGKGTHKPESSEIPFSKMLKITCQPKYQTKSTKLYSNVFLSPFHPPYSISDLN